MTVQFTLPEEAQLEQLPQWARLAFAVRCVRFVQPLLDRYDPISQQQKDTVEQALRAAELNQHATYDDTESAANNSYHVFYELLRSKPEPSAAISVASPASVVAWGVARTCRDGSDSNHRQYWSTAASTMRLAEQTVNDRRILTNLAKEINDTYAALREAARLDAWTDNTPVLLEFFATRSIFELDLELIEIASIVDAKLREYCRHHPERLFELTPRQFEELVAELFDGFGFEVELTQRTRDGGRDIVAMRRGIYRAKCLIECKHYAKHRKVGIAPVRALHGTTLDDRATKGILATTARFSKPANEYFAEPMAVGGPRFRWHC